MGKNQATSRHSTSAAQSRRLTIEKAHAIGEKVQRAIEKLDEISRAFIHIDPLKKA